MGESGQFFRIIIKTAALVITILLFFVVQSIVWLAAWAQPERRLKWLCWWVGMFSRVGLRIMGFRVHVPKSWVKRMRSSTALIVCNHLSYTDILIIAAYVPCAFVTSVEMKESLGLGWIVRIAGCIFVERRNRMNISKEVEQITNTLLSGMRVIIFPEATSTNGSSVLRFRTPLFHSAIDAAVPVEAIVLNYSHLDGKKITTDSRDYVCWYGDMTFIRHALLLSGYKKIDVHIVPALSLQPPYVQTHKELALETHGAVAKAFHPFV